MFQIALIACVALLRRSTLLGVAFLVASLLTGMGGDDGTPSAVVPLDLPAGYGVADRDEDDSETIVFYGQEYEGEGFFWCLDASGSMAVGGKMEVLKGEVTAAVSSLSRSAEFAIVAFNQNHTEWSAQPRRATPAAKASAITWVQALTPNSWTCLAPAGVRTLALSQLCRKRGKAVLVVGDGQPLCEGVDTSALCLTAFQTANWQRTPVHTLFIGDGEGAAFMQQLAQENGGRFVQVL
ncbi:MAG: hypothetical protein AAF581_03680 [Planctomycetota bacterium]